MGVGEHAPYLSAFWAHPKSGHIWPIDAGHTVAAVEPGNPIGLDLEDYGGDWDDLDVDDFRVLDDAFKRGWVRGLFLRDEGEIDDEGLWHASEPGHLILQAATMPIAKLTMNLLSKEGLNIRNYELGGRFDNQMISEAMKRLYLLERRNVFERFAEQDVENLSWFWANPNTSEIFHFQGSHTYAAVDPNGPIGLDPEDFGPGEIQTDDFRVLQTAMGLGWVRAMFLPGERSQVGLHGANKAAVTSTLDQLLEGGLRPDFIGMRGEFDDFAWDGELDDYLKQH